MIRKAHAGDISAIAEIYNEAVIHTTGTFDTQTKTLEQKMGWFDDHDEDFPVWVALSNQSAIVGWIAISRWSGRCAYAQTGEISLFVRRSEWGKGIGKRLLAHSVANAGQLGLHTLLARIASGNESSLHLHRQAGFEQVGILREVGLKFGQRLDVHLFQRMIPACRSL